MKGRNILISIVLLTSIILTTIVYSAFSTQLQISGEAIVRSDNDIRITNVRILSQINNAYETYNNKYTKDTTSMFVNLSNNSTILYEVTITNKSNNDYYVSDLIEETISNSNIKYEFIDLYANEKILKNSTKIFNIRLSNTTSLEQVGIVVIKYSFVKNLYFSKYLKNHYYNSNNELFYDNTIDNNLRYVGNNPNNYIYFNGELWRIIGVMNNIKNNNQNETRVKIIRNESIGTMMWNEVNNNTWETSTLANFLNVDYLNGISLEDKKLIGTATWNISKLYFDNSTYTYYENERLNSNIPSNVWIGNIGLYYPSDFGFSTGGSNRDKCLNSILYQRAGYGFENCYKEVDGCLTNNWLYNGNETWFINAGGNSTRVMFLEPSGYIDFGGSHSTPLAKLNVYPTLYLNSDVLFDSGTGTIDNPYKIKSE